MRTTGIKDPVGRRFHLFLSTDRLGILKDIGFVDAGDCCLDCPKIRNCTHVLLARALAYTICKCDIKKVLGVRPVGSQKVTV